MRSLNEKLGLAMLVQLVIGDPTGVQAILVASGPELLGLKFSRDCELEADASGFRYLADAGLDPTGMAAMFRKLEQDHAEAAGTLKGAADALSLLSTHPPARERFEALDAMAAGRAGGPPPAILPVDFAAFQERLRGLAAGGEP